MNLSRGKRRNLESRADRLLTKLRGAVVATSGETSPRTCVVLLTERTRPTIVARSNIQPAMHAMGLHIEGLDDAVAEIAASAQDDGGHYPVLLLLDGWLQVAFIEARTLSRGGQA